MLRVIAVFAFGLLSPAPGQAMPNYAEGERTPLVEVRHDVRAEVSRLYGKDCGRITVPDRAFVPVEITGGGNPEYAMLLGRATCGKWGQRWSGTGGPIVQFWYASDGPPRMLLEHTMYGFTPIEGGLLSLQHGTTCPGGAGPNPCLVLYRWNLKDRALEVRKRTFIDDVRFKTVPRMRWEYEAISR